MTKDDLVLRLLDKHDELRNYVNKSYSDAQFENIKQQRNLIAQFITISSGIVGFTLPVLGNSSLIQNKILLISGLFELLIVVLYGFWYLRHIVQEENKSLEKVFETYTNLLNDKHAIELKFIKEMSNENYIEWREKTKEVAKKLQSDKPQLKPDYSIDILFSAFFLGLCLIVLSITNLN